MKLIFLDLQGIYYEVDLLLHHVLFQIEINATQGYFKNLLRLNTFSRRVRIKLLYIDREDIFSHLPVFGYHDLHYFIQPYYWSFVNTLIIPAGALLQPMYDNQRPNVFNYGALGSLIAGEMFEAISKSGMFNRFVQLIFVTFIIWLLLLIALLL